MRLLVCLLLIALTSCNATPEVRPETGSTWGRVFTITQTAQADAPAFTLNRDAVPFAWVGSDERGVHHDVRILSSSELSPANALPLSPIRPTAFSLIPTFENNTLLFYLDANDESETRLFSAMFWLDRSLRAGPTPISTANTRRYAVGREGDTLWIVWSGGLVAAEPTLYAQSLDTTGRPRPPEPVAYNADHPVLLSKATGRLELIWLGNTEVYRAQFSGGVITGVTAVALAPRLQPGERLVNFTIGQDSDTLYLFWNTVLPDGRAQTWFTTEASAPVRLAVNLESTAEYVTGYNGGIGQSAGTGEMPVMWVAPVQTQTDPLPVAAQIGSDLTVLYFSGGQIAGVQSIVTLQNDLIGLPSLAANRERHLYLAWSEPASVESAVLRFTTTNPFYSSVVTNTTR
jgi:hypothetical protein